MISYPTSRAAVNERIGKLKKKWFDDALAATAACEAAGAYVKVNLDGKKIDGLWGDIKEVFMEIQGNKCCYCERLLESPEYGKIEHDVEHFRPKSRVKNWFTPANQKALEGWPSSLGRSGAKPSGYYRLAFDPMNYATSCKTCNSTLKSDHFPVAGSPLLTAATSEDAQAEKPWLIFPLADGEDLAEDLIQFDGIVAQPVHEAKKDPERHWRARVTIRFFRLNRSDDTAANNVEEGRENLYRERAEAISALADCLDAIETTTDPLRRKLRAEKVQRLTDPKSRHTNCCRSFFRLWTTPATRARAVEHWMEIEKYLNSQGVTRKED